MESVKKSIDKRELHKREYDNRVNERQMHTTEEKVDTSKALDANIKPIYDKEPMAEVPMTADNNEQPEFNNEGEVDQNAEQCTSINVQKEQTLNLSARTPIDREKIKALMVGNRIDGRPFSHEITLEKAIEISARPKFQGEKQ
ncbi:hypothetical protein Tco_1264610 [Tanacetum coccineum]